MAPLQIQQTPEKRVGRVQGSIEMCRTGLHGVDSGNGNQISSEEDWNIFTNNKSGIVSKVQQKFKSNHNDFRDEDDLLLTNPVPGKSGFAKCAWLRSQIIGYNSTIETPFGERHLTYADHTASGRSLRHIESFMVQKVMPFYGNTHTDDSFVGARTTKMVNESAKYIKHCLGGGRDDVLICCGSGCTAALKRLQEVMGLAVPSILRSRVLETMPKEERWIVFTGPYEHHSNLLSWRQSLAEVVDIPANSEGLIDMVALNSALEAPEYSDRPKLGSFSACSNVTGLITDTKAIARILHQHGAFACFDFAASGPYVHIDMRSGEVDGFDALVISPHKFLGGPATPGILLMSQTLYLLNRNPPSTCGGGTVDYVNHFSETDTLYHEDIEEREDAGTPPILQKIRCALCFWVKEYVGFEFIEQREAFFLDVAMKRLSENPNIQILGNTTAKRQPILSFILYSRELDDQAHSDYRPNRAPTEMPRYPHNQLVWRERRTLRGKPLHGRFVVKLLNDLFGIQARGGCACAGPYGHLLLNIERELSLAFRNVIKQGYGGLKPGWSRLSFSYYITDVEFDYILSSIEFMATFGQRFLPLYNFNWKTGDWTFNSENTTPESAVFSDLIIPKGQDLENLTRFAPQPQDKYEFYLSKARSISRYLHKFPEERSIPEGIDHDLILFRV